LRQENKKAEVLNMGIPSIGPKDYLSLLAREGLALQPDMILLSFFIGNDFSDSNRTRELHSYSYLASLLRYIQIIRPKLEDHREFDGHGKRDYCDDCPTFDDETYLQMEKARSSVYLKYNTHFLSLLDDALYYLTQIKDLCKKRNIEFVVILIPDELQINDVLQAEIRKTYSPELDKDQWDITLPNTILAGV
jgi:hypothetical protein